MKHALVIEDNHLIAMMIEDELVAHGYPSVKIATSQEQAIEMARLRCPDLITADDQLESGSGVETIREICRDYTIPVVFITARPNAVLAVIPDAITIPKPFWRDSLKAAIEAAIDAPTKLSASG